MVIISITTVHPRSFRRLELLLCGCLCFPSSRAFSVAPLSTRWRISTRGRNHHRSNLSGLVVPNVWLGFICPRSLIGGRLTTMVLFWVLPVLYGISDIGAYISWWCFFFLLDIVMFAFVPAIVVEGRGTVDALKRSWHLCKSQRHFVFCTYVGFCIVRAIIKLVIMEVASLVFKSGLFPAHVVSIILILICYALFDVLTMSIGQIFGFVLYMSVRILNENITQVELTHEFGSSLPADEVVDVTGEPMTDYQNANVKSSIIELV
eukprot:215925_1